MSKKHSKAMTVAKPAKVPTLRPGNDEEEIRETFATLFADSQSGARRIVAFGVFAQDVKLNKLKHGQFGPWVKASFPDISYRSVRAHMQLAESALAAAGYKSMRGFLRKCVPFQNGRILPISHGGELLLLPETAIPDEAKPMRAKVCQVVDGKSPYQLFTEFKQADEDEENLEPKRGRLKGQGGKGMLTLEEKAARARDLALLDWENIDDGLAAYGAAFCYLGDDDVQAQMARLEQALAARHAWLKQAYGKRDAAEIQQRFNK